jgi:uncharacterized protein HemX
MSIIYEALKKVESEKTENSRSEIPVKQTELAPSPKNPKGKNKFRVYLLALLAISLAAIYLSSIKSPTRASAKKQNFISNILKASAKMVGTTTINTVKTSPYNLEGIVYDNQESFAIINGKMLKKTEFIDDFQVSEITATSVELLNSKDNTKHILYL